MYALLENTLNECRGAWRFRWTALITAWVVCLLGWPIVLAIPDTYEASARVFVDTRTTLSSVTQGITVESNVATQIQRVRQALLGGPQLEKVAREADLDSSGGLTPQQWQGLISQLRDRIEITGTLAPESATAGLYVISYRDRDRDRTLRVVDRLVNTFVESAMGGKREGSVQAQRFLTEQISEYERRLGTAEERLATFKKENVGLMPGAQGDYFSRLQTEMDLVTRAQASLRTATRRRDELERQVREQPLLSGAAPTAVPGGFVAGGTDTGSRIREAQARLDELLLRFTEKHPDVMALRGTIADLEARQKEEQAAIRRGDPGAAARAGLGNNPVFQNIQLQLNQAEVEIAALRGEIGDRERKIADLRKLVNTAPEVEAEFARLNRDYDVTRAQYQSLVERLERTRFSESADETGIVRFEVIDPPTAGFSPVAPNRVLLLIGVLGVSIGAGIALAVLRHRLKPVFSTARQLSAVTGLPVLGVVSMTWLDRFQAQERRSVLVYAAAAGLFFLAAGLMLFTQSPASRLLHQLAA